MQSLRDIHTYKVIEAWYLFMNEGIIMDGVLRPEIVNSWIRSKAINLNPWDVPQKPIPEEEMAELSRPFENLIKCALPIMHYLYAINSKLYLDNIITLVSETGLFITKITRPSLYPITVGKYCSEEKVGTCAGAIALKEKKAFVVGGYENYMAYHQSVFAGATPILRSNEDLIGVLGIFNAFGKIPEQPLEMIITAAHIIEDLLERQESFKSLVVETSPIFTTLINLAKQNILLFNNEGYIVNANEQNVDLLDLPTAELIGKNIRELGIDPNLILVTKSQPDFENFEVTLHGRSIPCILNNCTKVTGYNDQEFSLLLFSEDILRKKAPNKMVNVPFDSNNFSFKDIIGTSDIFLRVIELARRAAQVTSTVLIEGESGSGKDVLALAIHNTSPRKGPFIAINCGAIQHNLLQSELFGYEEGSFTGAAKGGKPGKFELAEGGTLFLDEIGEMPMDMQVSLLRVLENKCVRRVGGSTAKKFDVRVIAATNIDIKEAVANGTFRKDLYYRLNVIDIKMPALRERKEDIPLLADYLVKSISQRMGMGKVTITNEAVSILQQYSWPGNIRELSNVLENSLIFTTTNKITPDLLPASIIKKNNSDSIESKMERSEREIIIETLKLHNDNISRSAKDLGISRNTLYKKIYKYHIDGIIK